MISTIYFLIVDLLVKFQAQKRRNVSLLVNKVAKIKDVELPELVPEQPTEEDVGVQTDESYHPFRKNSTVFQYCDMLGNDKSIQISSTLPCLSLNQKLFIQLMIR
jgi:hypothetical protein